MLIPRPQVRIPAKVSDSWSRIKAWWAIHWPPVIDSLLPGATEAELDELERLFRHKLPDDYRELYRINNGQKYDQQWPGAFIGQPFDALKQVMHTVQFNQNFILEQEVETYVIPCEWQTSSPPYAIRRNYTSFGTLPIGDWDGNCYGLDFDPGPNGISGQIINFGRDEEEKYVLATSLAHFLEDIADEIEAGNVVVGSINADERSPEWIGRPESEDQSLLNFYKDWSEAKLPTDFQSQIFLSEPVPLPGEPLSDADPDAAAARQLVEQFIQVMHEYEAKWLAIRPIQQLGYTEFCESSRGYWGEEIDQETVSDPEQLHIGVHVEQAIAEKAEIFRRFCTPTESHISRWRADMFVQTFPLTYDPARDRVSEVRRESTDLLAVYLQQITDQLVRFRIYKVDGRWLILSKNHSSDHVSFDSARL